MASLSSAITVILSFKSLIFPFGRWLFMTKPSFVLELYEGF